MRLTLLKRMLFFILVPSILGLSVLAFFSSLTASLNHNVGIDKHMFQLVQIQADEIESTIDYLQKANQSASTTQVVENFARLYATNPISLQTQNALDDVTDFLNEQRTLYSVLSSAFIVAPNGKIISSTHQDEVELDVSGNSIISSALEGVPYIDSATIVNTNNLAVYIAQPIFSENDSILGAIVFRIDLQSLYDSTLAGINLDNNMITYVYDSNFKIIMDAKPENMGRDDSELPHISDMMLADIGMVQTSTAGLGSMGHYAYVPIVHWYIMLDTPVVDRRKTGNDLFFTISTMALVLIVGLSIVIFSVARSVAVPVRKASEIATHIADGNIKITDEQKKYFEKYHKRGDEIGDFTRGLGIMIAQIAQMITEADERATKAQQTVQELKDVVNIVASASEELSAQVELTSQGINSQTDRIANTTIAMEEMNSTVLEVARNSEESAQLAEQTKQKAITGAKITEKCKASITEVERESLKLRDNMNVLADHAQSINTIMRVITDIADQTNLLALNAAIEAARAGDAGRGFAVVADEVRKLAEKTIASATNVGNAITAIQESTQINVKQVDVAVQKITDATGLATDSGEALREILDMADRSASGIRAIATASEEQSATVSEVTNAIEQIHEIATNTNNAMVEASEAVVALSGQAQELTSIIDSMK